MPDQIIALCGVLGRGDDQDELNKRFGSFWRKMKFKAEGNDKNIYYIKDEANNIQMTLWVLSGAPFEFAIYLEDSFESFRKAFEAGEVLDCTYHRIDSMYKHIGLQVVKVLKEQDLW